MKVRSIIYDVLLILIILTPNILTLNSICLSDKIKQEEEIKTIKQISISNSDKFYVLIYGSKI